MALEARLKRCRYGTFMSKEKLVQIRRIRADEWAELRARSGKKEQLVPRAAPSLPSSRECGPELRRDWPINSRQRTASRSLWRCSLSPPERQQGVESRRCDAL